MLQYNNYLLQWKNAIEVKNQKNNSRKFIRQDFQRKQLKHLCVGILYETISEERPSVYVNG